MSNRNSLWASILVSELAKAGLKHVCMAPGSRSTPLVMAFASQADIKVYTHFDERSAAFFALGLAKNLQEPVALVCTSGTAAVNFFPAIVEAHESAIPLLVLTADRPHELRNSGANQSINQVNLYGSYALMAVDVALPEQSPSAELINSLRTTVARAYATASGVRKGVVQLNLPFRKPLEPSEVSSDVLALSEVALGRERAYTRIPQVKPLLDESSLESLAKSLASNTQGLIICGVDCPRDNAFTEALSTLAKVTGFPILADGASGLRLNKELDLITGYDSFLGLSQLNLPKATIIIRFGKMATSAVLARYLKSLNPKHDWQINAAGMWADDSHHLSQFIQADETQICLQLAEKLELLKHQPKTALKEAFEKLETRSWAFWQTNLAKHYFDGAVLAQFVKSIPKDSLVFVGNSLSIRHLDQFIHHEAKNIKIFANRGASGIDGNISTALGISVAEPHKRLFMILGDLSFYHDMNGLVAIKQLGIPATILLINNEGGGIFHRLPISKFEPQFTDYFLTPHKLEFFHAAQLYGLEHQLVLNFQDLDKAIQESHSQQAKEPKSHLIEAKTNSHEDHHIRQNLMNQYQAYMLKETQ